MEEQARAFSKLVAASESELTSRLDEALLLIAAAAQPHLDVATEMARLDELAAQADASSAEDLAHWLFAERFVGNGDDYYNPENSYFNRVLDLNQGIPITLSALYIEIGRRHNMVIEPVGMPGHFLTRIGPDSFVDSFGGGAVLDKHGCERLFQRLTGQRVPLPSGALDPTSSSALVQRVIANLRGIGHQKQDARVTELAVRFRAAFPSPRVAELLELAQVLASRSEWGKAAEVADTAASELPAPRAESVRSQAIRWRARLN